MTGSGGSAARPSALPEPGPVWVAPRSRFAPWAASKVAGWLREVADAHAGPVAVALAGGSTPRPVYESIAEREDVPWERLEVFFGDERAVPPDDSQSNFRMARESLLDRVPIPAARVHRMRGEADSLDQAARDYAGVLPATLDVVLLGIGSDGHTASLFPGGEALGAEAAVAPATAPSAPRRRLTVTPPVLARARRLVVLATGAEKAGPVARALVGTWDPAACPAQLARRGTWLLDADSAAQLPPGLRTVPAAGQGRPA